MTPLAPQTPVDEFLGEDPFDGESPEGAYAEDTTRRARPAYLPTPAEIAAGCADIRSRWSRSETIRRAVGGEVGLENQPWQPPRIDTSSCTSRVRKSIADQIA